MSPEEKARKQMDGRLEAAGWVMQSCDELNLSASPGVAARELQSQGGPADSILSVQGKAPGIVGAQKEGETLSHVARQSVRYSHSRHPLAVARKAFGGNPISIIEELNSALIA